MSDTPEKTFNNDENPVENTQPENNNNIQDISSPAAEETAEVSAEQTPAQEFIPQTPDHVKVIAKEDHPAFKNQQISQNDTADTQSVASPDDITAESVEKEVQEALGDMSLMDMDTVLANTVKKAGPEADKPIPGILRGYVLKVESDGVFVAGLGGKSEGFLPKDEIEEGEVLKENDPIDVCIVRRDPKDGLLILSRNAATQQIMLKNLKNGDHVEVTVTGSNKGGLDVKIKGGVKAFMPISQIDIYRVEDEDKDKFIGQKMVCQVTQADKNDKNIVVSRRKVMEAEQEANADKIWDELEAGQIRRGTVRSLMEYGAFVDLGGIDGLVHISEISWGHIDKPADMLVVGQQVEVFIKEINQDKKRLALSLKLAHGDPWANIEEKYPVGLRTQAKIVRLMNFGAFAELEPGIEGLIPVSEMSWLGRVNHPKEVVSEGDVVEVDILKCSKDNHQISMSIKAVQGNPWENIEDKYIVEQDYEGKVVRLSDFGAFVELEPGVDGLVHISEISDKHIKRPCDAIKEGEEVKVRVLEVDPKRKRIGLSMKALLQTDEPTETAAALETEAVQTAKPKRKKNLKGGISGFGDGGNSLGLTL